MNHSSPGKNVLPQRIGSASERNIPSPSGRRDPTTPNSRIVRSQGRNAELVPLDGTAKLAAAVAAVAPPVQQAAAVSRPQDDEVVDEVVTTPSMYESPNPPKPMMLDREPSECYEEQFETDSDEDPPEHPVTSSSAPTHSNTSPQQKDLLVAPLANVSEVRRSNTKRPAFNIRVEKKERVGRGTFGDVFRAIDLDTGTEIAVKEIVVAQDCAKDLEKQIHTLEREIRVMQKLDHPNTVKYLGAKRQQDTLNIYMEFVSGGTVASLLRHKGPLSEDAARRYAKQLLCGLDYLHDKKIAHRDLKGDNLFLTKDDVLKVGDFGTSKELQTMRVTDSVAGTPNFMAPEVIACSGHSFQADIWSIGCCIIQMVVGKPPFANMDNHMAVMFAVMKGQIDQQIPKDISLSLRDFLEKCTKTDPKERATTKQLLMHPWITGEELAAPLPPPGRPAGARPGSGGTSTAAQSNEVAPPSVPVQPPKEEKTTPSFERKSPPPSAGSDGGHNNTSHDVPHKSRHPPVIVPMPRLSTSRDRESLSRSPPPSAGSTASKPGSSGPAPTTKPSSSGSQGAKSSHFLARFPRHGLEENPDDPPTPQQSSEATPMVAASTASLTKSTSKNRISKR